MTADSQGKGLGIEALAKDLPAEVGFAAAGADAVFTALLSAAAIHVVLTRPIAVADALTGPGVLQFAKALAILLVAAVRDLAGFL